MSAGQKGLLIVFEGVEGSGKSTQCRLLSERLTSEGISNIRFREPGGTDTGENIRTWLAEGSDIDKFSELFLLSAARIALVKQKLKPSLMEKRVVVLDRYIYSTIAYQGFARGIRRNIIDSINSIATEGLDPHKAFLLDIDPEISFERKRNNISDRWESEDMHFHHKVRDGYLSIAEGDPALWKILDASSDEKSIHQLVWQSVIELF
ncbi:MAG: dTMP kinase [Chloroflexota bacterium]|nr:dTMP kinase [Chloroflexota bacterium]